MLRSCAKVFFAVALLAAGSAAAEPASTLDGVFNELQVGRGEKLATKYCAACHDEAYFTGVFLRSWNNQPVQGLYDLIRQTMPRDRPGALKERQYAELLAYIFALNGMPLGEEKLDYKNGRLGEVVIRLAEDVSAR